MEEEKYKLLVKKYYDLFSLYEEKKRILYKCTGDWSGSDSDLELEEDELTLYGPPCTIKPAK
jgi:hypothetical protein